MKVAPMDQPEKYIHFPLLRLVLSWLNFILNANVHWEHINRNPKSSLNFIFHINATRALAILFYDFFTEMEKGIVYYLHSGLVRDLCVCHF